MVRIRVEVTEDDIREGKACDEQACPIALAIQRLHPNHKVWVYGNDVLFRLGSASWSGFLSRRAAQFVEAFDCGYRPGPFRFWLDLPTASRDQEEARR